MRDPSETATTSAEETWITVPEAARLRSVKEHVIYSRLRYGRLEGRRVATTFVRARVGNRPGASMELWRWEVKLSDVMAMDITAMPRRGAGGPYSGPPSKKTLDHLMEAIEAAQARSEERRTVVTYQQSESEEATTHEER